MSEGKFAGYCGECGMILMKKRWRPAEACPRCGGVSVTDCAPKPASQLSMFNPLQGYMLPGLRKNI